MKNFWLIGCLFFSSFLYAKDIDVYEQCSARFETTNNAIVEECSGQAKEAYIKETKQVLTKIKQQTDEEQYKAVLKAQVAWRNYVEIECNNQGYYIGSPLYGVCPMYAYKERVAELKEYLHEVP